MTDYPSTVIGWRFFALRGDALVSPFLGNERDVWQRGPNFARCVYNPRHVPDADCSCGFRAVEDIDELARMLQTIRRFSADRLGSVCDVLALVELSGRILPGVSRGDVLDVPTTWRAGQARLLELHPPPHHADVADGLRDRYGVPVNGC